MSDEEANNGTTTPELPSTGTIIRETILNNRCRNPKCFCNQKKKEKEKRSISLQCMFGFHDYHLPFSKTYYECRRCGEEPAYGP